MSGPPPCTATFSTNAASRPPPFPPPSSPPPDPPQLPLSERCLELLSADRVVSATRVGDKPPPPPPGSGGGGLGGLGSGGPGSYLAVAGPRAPKAVERFDPVVEVRQVVAGIR